MGAMAPSIGQRTWNLVREQHGVITRDQLLALGWTADAIKHRLATGRLYVVWPGVYVVGRPDVSRYNEADKRRLVDPERLRGAIDHLPRTPGIAIVRATLDHRTFTLTDSRLERLFIPIALRAGLPMPLTQRRVNGFRVDFYWPELRLIVETDGLTYHRTPAQQAEDALRSQVHSARGFIPLRFTRAQVKYEPAYVESILREVVARISAAATPA